MKSGFFGSKAKAAPAPAPKATPAMAPKAPPDPALVEPVSTAAAPADADAGPSAGGDVAPASTRDDGPSTSAPDAPVATGDTAKAADGDDADDLKPNEGTGLPPNAGNGLDLEAYNWTQSLSDLQLNVPVPPGTRGRDCDVQISAKRLKVGLKGAEKPVLDGELHKPVVEDECFWNCDGKQIEVCEASCLACSCLTAARHQCAPTVICMSCADASEKL